MLPSYRGRKTRESAFCGWTPGCGQLRTIVNVSGTGSSALDRGVSAAASWTPNDGGCTDDCWRLMPVDVAALRQLRTIVNVSGTGSSGVGLPDAGMPTEERMHFDTPRGVSFAAITGRFVVMQGIHLRRLAPLVVLAAALPALWVQGPQAATAVEPLDVTTGTTIAAVGDFACDSDNTSFKNGAGTSTKCQQKKVSDVMVADTAVTAVLGLGDFQYYCDDAADFAVSYTPSWGRVNNRMNPVAGNHEYTGRARPLRETMPGWQLHRPDFFNYFGAAAHPRAVGHFSFDIGNWHLIGLNAQCSRKNVGGCSATSPQTQWLAADLAATTQPCTLAFWHQPLFTGSGTGKVDDLPTLVEHPLRRGRRRHPQRPPAQLPAIRRAQPKRRTGRDRRNHRVHRWHRRRVTAELQHDGQPAAAGQAQGLRVPPNGPGRERLDQRVRHLDRFCHRQLQRHLPLAVERHYRRPWSAS